MDISRRDFLKVSGVASVGLLLGTFGFDLRPIRAYAEESRPEWISEAFSICPYCGCGCGVVVGSKDGIITYVQGDPDNPINRGALCSKGQASIQLSTVDGKVNPQRVLRPRYRAPYSNEWVEISWDQAINEIAQKIKAQRDSDLIQTDDGVTVNRLETIAALGTAKDTNEECYLYIKLMRALGIVYVEHCARV